MQLAAPIAALTAACLWQAAGPVETTEVTVRSAVRQAEAAPRVTVDWEAGDWTDEFPAWTSARAWPPVDPVPWLASVAEFEGGALVSSHVSGGGQEVRLERFPHRRDAAAPRRFHAADLRAGTQRLPGYEELVRVTRRLRTVPATHVAHRLRPLFDPNRGEGAVADVDQLVITAPAPQAARILFILDQIDPPAAGGK